VRCALCDAVTSTAGSRTARTYQQQTIPTMLQQNAHSRNSPHAYVQCAGCALTLQYPRGAASVRCGSCGTVSSAGTTSASGAGGTPTRAVSSKNLVVIENPPTIDEGGRVVSNIAIGVKLRPEEE